MKKKFWGVVAIVVVIAALLGVYYAFREQPSNQNAGPSADGVTERIAKSVTIEVVEAEGLSFETTDGMVMVVNGKRADYVLDGAYWGFYVNGEYCNYGISDQPVNDGDEFRIEYTKA